jgi:hypothetical protein
VAGEGGVMLNETTIDDIRKRHAQEIEEFQALCLHAEISVLTPYMWAPGHFGNDVRVCKCCGKIVETKLTAPRS